MLPVFEGRQNIADTVFANIRELDTTHTVTNPRITTYDGEHASLFALVQAQRVPKRNHARHLLLANIYRLDLSKQGESWAIDHLRIDNVWMTGDRGVLFDTGVG